MIRSKSTYFFLVSNWLVVLFLLISCTSNSQNNISKKIIPAADQTEKYIPLLKGKNVVVVANQTTVIHKAKGISGKEKVSFTHLVDSLLSLNINIVKVFAPEHGFRGKADAGEHVSNHKDIKTGLPILSLYGENRKPGPEQLEDIDLVVFDIQDVGVRFYTYISTMTYVMEACAELDIPVIILDRPNPNGHYVDGPILEMEHKSFVGMHPVPLVYGMTIGEYARMVNGEKWMKNGVKCNITIIPLINYTHNSEYSLAIRPSPNLPNSQSINLYPSLGFFEGTIINAGRGTEFQFQRYGAPFFPQDSILDDLTYTPQPNFGSKNPKFKGELCYGVDLSKTEKQNTVNLKWLVDAYHKTPREKEFFGKSFTIHAGTLELQKQIESGKTAEEIRASWQKDVNKFKKVRSKYLIYD
jgi:uncharacterized protein YbbC (DUF1343 family)